MPSWFCFVIQVLGSPTFSVRPVTPRGHGLAQSTSLLAPLLAQLSEQRGEAKMRAWWKPPVLLRTRCRRTPQQPAPGLRRQTESQLMVEGFVLGPPSLHTSTENAFSLEKLGSGWPFQGGAGGAGQDTRRAEGLESDQGFASWTRGALLSPAWTSSGGEERLPLSKGG